MPEAARRVPFQAFLSLLWRELPSVTFRTALLALAWLIPLLGALWTLRHAPGWLEPREVRIDLIPGQSAILGHDRAQRRDDLGSPYADAEHVRVLRTASGDWRLENVAASKQVLWKPRGAREYRRVLRTASGDWRLENVAASKQVLWKPRGAREYRRVREWPLTPGGQFAVGEHHFVVAAVAADGLTLQSGSQIWRYDGISLFRNDQVPPLCDPGGIEALRHPLLAPLRTAHPLSLGGGVRCATRLGLAGVPADSVSITFTAAGYVLRPGPAARPDGPPMFVGGNPEGGRPLRELTVPLAAGDQLIVGYTRYRVTQATGALVLAVTARGQRWPADEPRPASLPAVRVTLAPPAFLHGLEWPVVLALLAPWPGLLWLRGRYPLGPSWPARLGLILCLSLASGSLALNFWNDAGTMLWPYSLAWLALGGVLWAARRTGWSALLMGLLTWLLGWGLVAQLQLGVGADESGWLRYGNSTAALAGAFGWLLLAGLIVWRGFRPGWRFDERVASRSITALVGASLGLLGFQVLYGDEGGLGGFIQPFELTKLALVASVAMALAQRMGLHGWDLTFSKPQLWWRYLWPVLALVISVIFALLFLRDFSPLVLLAIGALAVAWAYLGIHPDRRWRHGGQAALAMAVVAVALGVLQLRQHPTWFADYGQSDRIRVWATPAYHPHAGYQLRQALAAVRAGGWWGVNAGALPGNTRSGDNGKVMAIPAVQDDFVPTFFLNRYGGATGLTLLAAQTLLILTLWRIGGRARDWTRQKNDYRLQALGGFAYFALSGGGGLLAGHVLVSWGTNLGFLPVMGQPMPLLSAAGSHLIFLIAPLVALALALEEGCSDEG